MNTFPLWLIPLLPFLAFLLNGLFGRWLKELGGWIAFGAMAASAGISIYLLVTSVTGTTQLPISPAPLWEWMNIGGLKLSVGFHYDQLTAVMCFVVTFVGSLVFLYSIGYMHSDEGFNRFFAYLSLFAFSMLILVLGDSFPLLFVGWEGVGLCSYLLIGYYLNMPGAPDAGKKAFIVNRIGDAGFLIAMFLIFGKFGTLDIGQVVQRSGEISYNSWLVTAITLFLFLGCTGKSAQIPLFTWLPDAMAGPTPVSALIHAATMVTAGVYLVVRTSPLFALAPWTMYVVAVTGAATAFVAGTIALTQRDIKKVLAYSTVSQLGFMFLACGVGAFSAGIFHVVTHAFFKACLFLGAGAVIHAVHGNQDLFSMGGLKKHLPVVFITFAVSCLAISGFPLTSGFFSKDEILYQTFSTGHILLYVVGLVTALMTVVYSMRILILTFYGQPRMSESVQHHIHHPHWTMTVVLVILAVGALIAGFFNVPHGLTFGLGEGANFEHFLGPVLHHTEEIMARHYSAYHKTWLEILLTLVSIGVVAGGIYIAHRFIYLGWPRQTEAAAQRFPKAYELSANRWWWDDAYNAVFAGGTWILSVIAVAFDTLIIDGLLFLPGRIARRGAKTIRNFQAGQVQGYALAVLIGANVLLLMVLYGYYTHWFF